MPSREEVHYFGAGPAALPTPVINGAAEALINYNGSGVGVAEISHRSADANKILADAKAALIELLGIPDDYEVMFMQGGGSGQFSAVVYHMVSVWVGKLQAQAEEHWKAAHSQSDDATQMEADVTAMVREVTNHQLQLDYLVTGSWSLKASQEAARLVGSNHVDIVTDARKHNDGKFGVIPAESTWNLGTKSESSAAPTANGSNWSPQGVKPALRYFCDNETVDGVEFPSFPAALAADGAPIVADMSSNFLSRTVDVKKYAIIFGGAQKNVGNAGVTIIIVHKSLLPPVAKLASADLLRALNLPVGPVVFDYATVAKNNSLYNTLPILDVWIAGNVMKRLCETYGSKRIAGQEELSNAKARLIYDTLDKYPNVYRVVPDKSVRSRMNICMRIKGGDADAEKAFLSGAESKLLLGLKGHRSVGGIRISNYNAVTEAGVKKLVQYLVDFAEA